MGFALATRGTLGENKNIVMHGQSVPRHAGRWIAAELFDKQVVRPSLTTARHKSSTMSALFPQAVDGDGHGSDKERHSRDHAECSLCVMKPGLLEFFSQQRCGDLLAAVRVQAT